MKNLFQLKKHLTILDAARHLTNILKDDVTEADVLELALDGHLKLSVNFVNYVRVRHGEFTGYENGSWCLLTQEMKSKLSANHPKYDRDRHNHLSISYFPPSDNLKKWPYKKNLDAHDDLYITLDKEVTTITGSWNLLLIGNERKYIENSIQQLRNSPLVTIKRLEGVFLEKDGDIYQLQEHIHKNKKQFGAMAQLQDIELHIKNKNLNEEDAEKLLNQHMVAKQELNSDIFDDTSNGYFPAPTLPMDCTLVVRTEALHNFEETIIDASNKSGKPTTPTDREYISERLTKLNRAAHKFWSDADRNERDTHPGNDLVSAWLTSQGFSPTLADKAATIIRPEWAPSGRKPEKEGLNLSSK